LRGGVSVSVFRWRKKTVSTKPNTRAYIALLRGGGEGRADLAGEAVEEDEPEEGQTEGEVFVERVQYDFADAIVAPAAWGGGGREK